MIICSLLTWFSLIYPVNGREGKCVMWDVAKLQINLDYSVYTIGRSTLIMIYLPSI